MSLIKDILRAYWSHILALAIFTCAAVRFWHLGDFLNEEHFMPFCFAFVGLVSVLKGPEWSGSQSGWDGLTEDTDWRPRPVVTFYSWWGPVLGGLSLVGATIWLYRL